MQTSNGLPRAGACTHTHTHARTHARTHFTSEVIVQSKIGVHLTPVDTTGPPIGGDTSHRSAAFVHLHTQRTSLYVCIVQLSIQRASLHIYKCTCSDSVFRCTPAHTVHFITQLYGTASVTHRICHCTSV